MEDLLRQQLLDHLTFRTGLVGYQGHAKNAGCVLVYFGRVLGQLYAAAFAAPARVDLGFYHDRKSPQLRSDLLGFLCAEGRFPSRDRDSGLLEQLLWLETHEFSFFSSLSRINFMMCRPRLTNESH